MNVQELINELKKQDPDRKVFVAVDPEESGFWPLDYVVDGAFKDGERLLEEMTEELRNEGFTDEEICTDGTKSLFLIPGSDM